MPIAARCQQVRALRRAEQEAHFWRQQFRHEQQLTTTLRAHIEFLEKKLERKLTSSTSFKTFLFNVMPVCQLIIAVFSSPHDVAGHEQDW